MRTKKQKNEPLVCAVHVGLGGKAKNEGRAVPLQWQLRSQITNAHLNLAEPQSRFGGKPLQFQVVCPHDGTAVRERVKSRTGSDRQEQ